MEEEKTNGSNEENKITEVVSEPNGNTQGNSIAENKDYKNGASQNAENQEEFKLKKALKELLNAEDTKFMDNFSPELSNREKRKLSRKFALEGKKNNSLYNEHGVIRNTGKDICDCLDENCVGCHFPCPKCRSCKCGQECRVNRKWTYESVENESDKTCTKNTIQTH